MPELPEAETIARDLDPRLAGTRIEAVQVTHDDVLGSPPAELRTALIGRTVTGVGRRGKNVVVNLDDASRLVVNLGMTGRLVTSDAPRAVDAPVPDLGQQDSQPGLPVQEVEAVDPRLPPGEDLRASGVVARGDGAVEVDADAVGPASGDVDIFQNALRLGRLDGDASATREADLSAYTSATLTLDYETSNGVDFFDLAYLEISNDGGASWTILQYFLF